MRRLFYLLSLLVLCAIALFAWQRGRSTASATAAPDLIGLLSEPASADFARATAPNNIEFPRDLGPHDDYQTEWWYYTGNLATEDGREFGFQFTIFRRALTPPQPASDQQAQSAWRSNQTYLAHFALTDVAGDQFLHSERYSRGGAQLAGAQAEPYRVWLEDWEIFEQDGTVRLRATAETYALDLALVGTLPPILHGDGGLSAKSLEVGNASYYYSQIHQQAAGTVTINKDRFDVTGTVWKDHEYSTSVLSEGAIGWDWVSLHLSDGSAVMLFEIRREDGSIEPSSSGTFVYPDGTSEMLKLGEWQLTVEDRWRSPHTGGDYPASWQLSVPKLGLNLTGEPKLADQELRLSSGSYWEGAVRFAGQRDGVDVSAEGYIELTGYARPEQ